MSTMEMVAMAFMLESRYMIQPTPFAMQAHELQQDYLRCWDGLTSRFSGS